MKNANNLKQLTNKQEILQQYDLKEIDNPNEYATDKILYKNRINKVIDLVEKYKPSPSKIKIGEFGCAQGNISLSLAEKGYEVYAIDINEDFLEYSKLKYENGRIKWILGSITDVHFDDEFFDVIILGEVIEHCAYPEDIISRITNFLKKDGIFILTTPNGHYFQNKLPTFSEIKKMNSRKEFENKQFGPDGKDHLFLFTTPELYSIIPSYLKKCEIGYLCSGLINIVPRYIFDFISPDVLITKLNKLYSINKYTCTGIYMVLQK